MSGKTGMTVVELSIVLALALLVAAIALPSLRQNRQRRQAAACAMNLDALAAAGQRYAAENGAPPAELGALVPTVLATLPVCPAGGVYAPGTAKGDPPTCSIHGQPY